MRSKDKRVGFDRKNPMVPTKQDGDECNGLKVIAKIKPTSLFRPYLQVTKGI